MQAVTGFCNYCRTRRQIKDGEATTFEGRTIVKGFCVVCNSKMFRVLIATTDRPLPR